MRIVWLVLLALGCSRDSMIHHRIVAHRGASFEAPENTLAAFRRAWELGAEAVELDARVSKDGEVVVFHDADTRRIASGARLVADLTLRELQALDPNIPTLAQALAIMPAGRTTHVEIKSGPETAPAIAKVIRAATPRGAHIVLQSYDAAALDALAHELPDSPAFWDIDPPKDQPYPLMIIDEAKRRGFAGLALDVRGVTDEFVAAARAANILVDVWTLNDHALIKHWLARDVRWIETDRPDLAR